MEPLQSIGFELAHRRHTAKTAALLGSRSINVLAVSFGIFSQSVTLFISRIQTVDLRIHNFLDLLVHRLARLDHLLSHRVIQCDDLGPTIADGLDPVIYPCVRLFSRILFRDLLRLDQDLPVFLGEILEKFFAYHKGDEVRTR